MVLLLTVSENYELPGMHKQKYFGQRHQAKIQ